MPDRARDERVASLESGVSLASMVTVAEPMDCPLWDAVTINVSSSSTEASSLAITVAVTEDRAAVRVRSVAERLWSVLDAVPVTARPMVRSAAKVLPLATATVIVDPSPSAIVVGCADTVHVGLSLASMVTVAEPMDCPPWTP